MTNLVGVFIVDHLFNLVPTSLPNPTAKDDLAAKNAISRITAFSMQERN